MQEPSLVAVMPYQEFLLAHPDYLLGFQTSWMHCFQGDLFYVMQLPLTLGKKSIFYILPSKKKVWVLFVGKKVQYFFRDVHICLVLCV